MDVIIALGCIYAGLALAALAIAMVLIDLYIVFVTINRPCKHCGGTYKLVAIDEHNDRKYGCDSCSREIWSSYGKIIELKNKRGTKNETN